MADKVRVWGGMGTKGRPELQKDIKKLADRKKKKHKLERRLEITTADNLKRQKQGKKARSVKRYTAEQILGRFRSPARKIRQFQADAAQLRAKAQGTKDKKTAIRYRQQADSLLKKAAALRGKPKKTATTQPTKTATTRPVKKEK